MSFFNNQNKPKFIETKTVKWENETVIKVDEGTFIKNIRMVNAEGNVKQIEIFLKDGETNEFKHMETLNLIMFRIYRYFYEIKKETVIPFFMNKSGIRSDIKFNLNFNSEKQTGVSGELRYDVYEIPENEIQSIPKNKTIKSGKVSCKAKAFINHRIRNPEKAKQITDKVEEEPFKLIIGDEIILVDHTKTIRENEHMFVMYEMDDELCLQLRGCMLPGDTYVVSVDE